MCYQILLGASLPVNTLMKVKEGLLRQRELEINRYYRACLHETTKKKSIIDSPTIARLKNAGKQISILQNQASQTRLTAR